MWPIQYRRSVNLTPLSNRTTTKKKVRLVNRLSHKTVERFHSFLQPFNARISRKTARLSLLPSTGVEDSSSSVRASLVAALAHVLLPGFVSTRSAGVHPFGCCTSQSSLARTGCSGNSSSVTGCAGVCSFGVLGLEKAGGGNENPSSVGSDMHDSACSRVSEGCWKTGCGGGTGSLLNSLLQNASPLGALRPSPP